MPRLLLVLAVILLGACHGPQAAAPAEDRLRTAITEAVVMDDGEALPLAAWLPKGPPCRVVLAVHGFNDMHLAFDDLAARLNRDCIAVYAYDQRGFGANRPRGVWPGTGRLVTDAIAMTDEVRRRHPGVPLMLLGESMGAAVVMLALADEAGPAVSGAVLLAPAVWARAVQPWYLRAALWLGVRLLPGMTVSRDWAGVQPSDDPEVLRYWDTHPLVIRETRIDALHGVTNLMDAALAAAGRLPGRSLILYGGEDEIVPPGAICALLERLPPEPAGIRLGFYPQGYHLLSRGDQAGPVRGDIAAWLRAPQAPLPSGRELDRVAARQLLCGG